MIRFTWRIFIVVTSMAVLGCSHEEPNPEERDPIFKDLEKRQAEHTKLYEEAKAHLKELNERYEKAEANSVEVRDLRRDIAKNKHDEIEHEQWAVYYRIRTDRRRIVDRMAYKEALYAKKTWPEPREYSDYLVNRRLVEASRNWSTRIPKLQDRLPSSTPSGGNKKKAEAE